MDIDPPTPHPTQPSLAPAPPRSIPAEPQTTQNDSPASKPKIAFVGLGAMGFGMASHLLQSGFPIAGSDVSERSLDRFKALGGRINPTPSAAVKETPYLLIMVARSAQADSLLFEPSSPNTVDSLPTNATILMCSTVSPSYIAGLPARLAAAGRPDITVVDCPVSGGATRAGNGTLSIFASSASKPILDPAAESILRTLASGGETLYCIPGALGAGSNTKLVHQILAGVNIAMASEAMGLVAVARMNAARAFEELKGGEGGSWMFGNRGPHMLDRGLGRYSAMSIISKDVGIVSEAARQRGVGLPVLGTAEMLFLMGMSVGGLEMEDDCELVRMYLPGNEGDLVEKQGREGALVGDGGVGVEGVKALMVGVHLMGVVEAMRFCEILSLDVDLMAKIMRGAAGNSQAFEHYFEPLKQARWRLQEVPGIRAIRDDMIKATDRAYVYRYPLHLSSAALQELQRELR